MTITDHPATSKGDEVLSNVSNVTLSQRSIVFRPLSPSEASLLRSQGRRDDSFEALVRRAMRFQVLGGIGRSALDPELRVGTDRAGAAALLRLAQHRPRDLGQWRLKTAILKDVGESGGYLGEMIRAALSSDATRFRTGAGDALSGDRSRETSL